MESKTIKISAEDILQIKKDIAFIKDQLTQETELTDWAKNELDEARKTPREEYVSHDEVKRMILKK